MAPGLTAGLVTAGTDLAAYLLKPTGSPATGELHVVTAAGVDKTIDTAVPIGSYPLSADGKPIIYAKVAGTSAMLLWADPSITTPVPKTVIATGVISTTLAAAGFYSAVGSLLPRSVCSLRTSPAAWTCTSSTRPRHRRVQRLNGEFDYLESVLPDDT